MFEEYGSHIDNKYVLIVSTPETRDKAIQLCKEQLEMGFHVLSNMLISHHPRFIHVKEKTNKPYYIYRVYNTLII